MSIKYYANRVQETSTSTGAGNLVLIGAPLGFRPFVSGIGANNTFNYYIYRQDTNFEWEIGVGYVSSSGGVNQLVRQRVVASSNGNNFVGFTPGTKYVETILSQDRANTSFVNVVETASTFSPPYMPATYIVDASTANVQVNLPLVTTQSDPIVMGFMLNKTIGSVYEQPNAIQLVPSGTETIAGTTGVDVSILNDYLQIVSVPSKSGWLLLDPIQDATNPYGSEGTIQFKSNSAFSGVDEFTWHSSNKLLIGDSGVATADIVLPASSGQTTIFNQNLVDNDLRVAGSGNTHLLFVDGGLNRVGVNSSVVPDTLSVNAGSAGGITISKSGVGPRILLSNTSVSGITSNNVIGSVVFSGLNNSGNSVQYGSIKSIIEDNTDNAEFSSLVIETVNNGAVEEIAIFSPSGVTLGSNSQNFDGIVLGAGSDNEGNNIVAGYFNSVCGENCVVLGANSTISSGTFGGAIGSDHSISGVNVWVFGGSGITASGNNKTILALDDENYFEIQKSGNFRYVTLTDANSSLLIDNISILTSGVDQNVQFTFLNASGIKKTGLVLTSTLTDVTNNSENSVFTIDVLSSGSSITALSLNRNNIVIGDNNTSGNNMVFGIDNIISQNDNVIFGKDIVATGSNNVLVGQNISLATSGSNITIVGKDNQCLSSGNLGVVMVGNGNQADEDYSIAIGVDNANSGLYSVSCGYLNGVHGDYSVGIGEGNLITSNYSLAIGRHNNLTTSSINGSIFAMGIANTGNVSNTGVLVGYSNSVVGSGGVVFGLNSQSSGNNNILLSILSAVTGVNNVLIGNSNSINGTGNFLIGSSSFISTGNNNFIFGNDIPYSGTSGIYMSNREITFVVPSGNSLNLNPTGINLRNTINAPINIVVSSGNGTINSSSISLSSGNMSIVVSGLSTSLAPSNIRIAAISDASSPNNSGCFISLNSIPSSPLSTGIRIETAGSQRIFVGASGGAITNFVNSSNNQTIASNGIYTTGSVINNFVNSTNNMSIGSTGIILSGSGITNFVNNQNYQTISSSKINTVATSLTNTVGSMTNSATTGLLNSVGSSSLNLRASSIEMTGFTISSYASFFNQHTLSISGLYIGVDRVDTEINANNKQHFASTGLDIIANQYLLNIDSFNYLHFKNSGLALNTNGTLNIEATTPSFTGPSKIEIIGTIVASGYSDSSKVSIGTSGIVYYNPPSATGVGSGLVIEDNIVKVIPSYDGVEVFVRVAEFSKTLSNTAKSNQLIDLNGYSGFPVYLNTTNMIEGKKFYIRNTSTSPTSEPIDIYEFPSTFLYTLGSPSHSNISATFVFDGTNWHLLMAGQ